MTGPGPKQNSFTEIIPLFRINVGAHLDEWLGRRRPDGATCRPYPRLRLSRDDFGSVLHDVKIAAYAFRNGAIQVSEAQRLTGRTWQTSKKDLDKLTRKGILEFEPGRYVRDPKAIYKLKKRPTNDVSPNGNG
jgi:hypothetical protein